MIKVQDTFVLARERQQEIQGFFNSHGLGRVVVPLPNISDKEFETRREKNQDPFFRPASHVLSYEDFMRAFGQGDHWTVTDEVERAKIGWEEAEQGYWFWAEVQAECPRLGTSWNDLAKKLNLHLLCLEEYVIVFHIQKVLTNTILDRNTACCLRTRYRCANDSGILDVNVWDGLVDVRGYRSQYLQGSCARGGGRLAEAV